MTDQIAPKQVSLLLVVLLNTFLLGFGHIYLGQTIKGIVLFIATPILAFATCGIGVIFLVLFAVFDGVLLARRLNSGEAIGNWQCF
ncbi:MAG: hypothetical protein HN348_09425 [Proteobacteria bacterium]|jgi:TM2 domain-containing membrane protein YozV|nr:hypothetical protein [Pseudomonadota bacterium]